MSFINSNFTPIGGQARAGNAPAHWSYESLTDNLADVQGADYFNEIATQVAAGDFINLSLADGKAIVTITSATDFPKEVVVDLQVIGGGAFPVEVFNGTAKNLVVTDNSKFFVMDNAGAQTVTIPENDSEAFPIGAEMDFLREGAGSVTFAVSGAAVLQSRSGLVTINDQYSAASLKKIDTDEWRLFGDLA